MLVSMYRGHFVSMTSISKEFCLTYFNYCHLASCLFFFAFLLGELSFRSYEAEIAYLDVESDETNLTSKRNCQGSLLRALRAPHKSERYICRINCKVCNEKPNLATTGVSSLTPHLYSEKRRWVRSKGRFLSVGAAVISCRNEKAPDGLVADAHLSDGFLHLILIRDCPHASYLWYCFFPHCPYEAIKAYKSVENFAYILLYQAWKLYLAYVGK